MANHAEDLEARLRETEARLREAEARLAANNVSMTSFHFAASSLISSAFSEPETLFETVLALACHLVTAERGAVYLRDPEGDARKFDLRAGRGPAPKALEGRLVDHVVRSRSMVFCPDVRELRKDLTLSPDLAAFLGGSFAVIPAIVDGDVLGVLCLAAKTGGAPFTDDDARFLTAYSGLAASAVHSAGLMVELRAKDRLEREMEIARTIQTSLLPLPLALERYEIATRMVPADRVGGDFFDVHRAGDGFWLGVGDVSSHGVTPGLIMMMVQSIFSTLVSSSGHDAARRGPADLLAALNRVVYGNIERLRVSDYVTLVLGRCTGDGRFVHAGAHLDILVARAGGRVDRFPTGGAWVGLTPDIADDLRESEVRLEAGDVMVLYTDGITEARSPAGELFESTRLADLVGRLRDEPLEVVRDRVFDAVDAWSLEQEDDRTVVVVRYKGP